MLIFKCLEKKGNMYFLCVVILYFKRKHIILIKSLLFLPHHASQYHNDDFSLHHDSYSNFGSLNYERCMHYLIYNDKNSPRCFRATALLLEFADTYIPGIYISTFQICLHPPPFLSTLIQEGKGRESKSPFCKG